MTLTQLVRLVLTTDAAVSALASDRVYLEVAPADLRNPFIVFEVLSDEPDVTMSGTSDPRRVTVEVTCWASRRRDARALGKAVYERLRDYSGGAQGLAIDAVIAGSDRWDYDGSTKLHMATRDYDLWVSGEDAGEET